MARIVDFAGLLVLFVDGRFRLYICGYFCTVLSRRVWLRLAPNVLLVLRVESTLSIL
jgi:hypothetical protein